MAKTHCINCQRYLGQDLEGDVYCKCQSYNIVRKGYKTKLIHKSLYTVATDQVGHRILE